MHYLLSLFFIALNLIPNAVEPPTHFQDFTEYLANRYAIQFVSGNKIEILDSGQEIMDKKLQMIDQAKHFIYLETFIFHADHFGTEIAEALIQKARHGVEIIFIYDVFGSLVNSDAPLLSLLEQSGIRVIPHVTSLIPREVWHRKTIIIDNRYAFIGGTNLCDYVLAREMDLSRWRFPASSTKDTTVFVQGPVVYEMYRDYLTALNILGQKVTRIYKPAHDCFEGDVQAGVLSFHPRENDSRVFENLYLDLITHAHEKILLESGYFIPTEKIIKALKQAADRGVEIDVLISFKTLANFPWRDELAKFIFQDLSDHGIRIYDHKKGPVHSKIAVFDNRYSLVGTVNLDRRSLILDVESSLIVDSPSFAQKMTKWIESGIEHSVLMTFDFQNDDNPIRHLYDLLLTGYTIMLSFAADY